MSERLGEHLWSKQREIARSLVEHRRTAVKACHTVGKTFLAARLAAWWIDVHPPGSAMVVSTSDTYDHVKGALWQEIGAAHRKGKLPGRINQTEWWIGDKRVGFGRKPADDDPTALQGYHARFLLVVIDEACGIPKALWNAALSMATGSDNRMLAIGNPDDPGSHFRQVCEPGSGWAVHQIAYLDSPNFTDEVVPDDLRENLMSPAGIEDMRLEYGEGSAPWMSKALGEFPIDAEDSVVRISAVRACMSPDPAPPDYEARPNVLGVDVGAGGDESVIYWRIGRRARLWRKQRTPDTMELVGMCVEAVRETGASVVNVDRTGVGQGVVDRLRELRAQGIHEAHIEGVMVGAKAQRPDRFVKLRDEIWWEVGRHLSEQGAWDLSDVDDVTIAQLTAPKYSFDSAGRVKVEKKEETKKRLGRSPDLADALLLAFYAGHGQTILQVPTGRVERHTDVRKSSGPEFSRVAQRLTERQGVHVRR